MLWGFGVVNSEVYIHHIICTAVCVSGMCFENDAYTYHHVCSFVIIMSYGGIVHVN